MYAYIHTHTHIHTHISKYASPMSTEDPTPSKRDANLHKKIMIVNLCIHTYVCLYTHTHAHTHMHI